MSMPKVFNEVILFVSEAMTRLFGVTDDKYPATGIQPYEGEVPDKKHALDR
jgi:hypothetical protein